jgi:uncharacterized protein (TIGR02466 family)
MSSTVIPLKGIPIFHETSNFVLNEEEKNIIIHQEKFKLDQEIYKSPHSSLNLYLLNSPELKRIKSFFKETINKFKENVLEIKNELYMTNSWFTINDKQHFHHKHSHPNVFLSMIYYVQCESGNLEFYIKSSLQEGFNFDYTVKNYNIFNCTKWTLKTKTNDIVIFPGWIDHKTTPNLSNEKRIALVANFFIRGKLGSLHEELYLK